MRWLRLAYAGAPRKDTVKPPKVREPLTNWPHRVLRALGRFVFAPREPRGGVGVLVGLPFMLPPSIALRARGESPESSQCGLLIRRSGRGRIMRAR